jgi:hypothetical protein
MSELNTIPGSGSWSDIQQLLNLNFANIAADLLGLKDAAYKFAGVYINAASLPVGGVASDGDYALVEYASGFYIYTYKNGWVNTQNTVTYKDMFSDWNNAPLATTSNDGLMTSTHVRNLNSAVTGVGNLRTQVNDLSTTVINNKDDTDLQITSLQTSVDVAMASIPYFDRVYTGTGSVTYSSAAIPYEVVYSTVNARFVALKNGKMYASWETTGAYSSPISYTKTTNRIYRTSGGLYTFNKNGAFEAFCDLVPKSTWNTTVNRLNDTVAQAITNKDNIAALNTLTSALKERVDGHDDALEALETSIDNVAKNLSITKSTAEYAATKAQAAQTSVESMESIVNTYGGYIGDLNVAVNTLENLFYRLRKGIGANTDAEAIDKLIELYNAALTVKT